jgi:hypothetical protein
MRYSVAALLFLGASTTLPAQWFKIKTPGIPRKPDGNPDLTAPAPRTPDGKPDLAGLWDTEDNTYVVNITGDLKPSEVRAWAEDVYRKRLEALDRDTPATRCLPGGPGEILGAQYRLMQQPNEIAILYGGGAYRQIFTDGRELPKDPNPTWWGYSVGHWEGDTLVVQSAGFNDRSWLDFAGHPHTEDLRVTERFHRRDFGHMELQVTLEDPKTFTRPFTISLGVNLVPDTEMLEYVCNENERDSVHLVGKASDETKTNVKPGSKVLSQYAGNYEEHDTRAKMKATIIVAGDELMFSLGGKGAVPLTALSETSFYFPGGFPVDFVKDDKGTVASFVFSAPGSDMTFVRTETAKP